MNQNAKKTHKRMMLMRQKACVLIEAVTAGMFAWWVTNMQVAEQSTK